MKAKFIFILAAFLGILFIVSCEKDNGNGGDGGGETKISSPNSSSSHNMGRNCMTCHVSGGQGDGWFNAAGTVWDSTGNQTNPNATVKLFTKPNGEGTLRATLYADAKGNFYTTAAIDFTGGLYPAVTGATTTKYMSTSITMGACNSCHGVSQAKMWVK